MHNKEYKVRCLEMVVKDNDIGSGIGIGDRRNGRGLPKLALEYIVRIGGKEAIESLERIIGNPYVNQKIRTYATNLLDKLICAEISEKDKRATFKEKTAKEKQC